MRGTCSPFRLSSGLYKGVAVQDPTANQLMTLMAGQAKADKIRYAGNDYTLGNSGYGLGSISNNMSFDNPFIGTHTVSDIVPTVSCFQGSQLNTNKN